MVQITCNAGPHTGEEVKPEVRIVLFESTDHWSEDIRSRGGRLFEVYLFDYRRRVHLCSMTPSYEMHWIQTIYSREFNEDQEAERDHLESEISDGNRAQNVVEYMNCHDADNLPFIDLSKWSMKYYDEIKDGYDHEENLHDAVIEGMIQAESESPEDYHSLIR